MKYKQDNEVNNKRLREKFRYIIKEHIKGGKKALAIETFGYERENQVSNLSSNNCKPTIKKMHMESMQQHHQIPLGIWEHDVAFNEAEIDQQIEAYRASLNAENVSLNKQKSIFKQNKGLFQKLKGVWYGYFYASNPNSAKETEGIWIVKTTINEDYTVVDCRGNHGYLKIGENQSIILKELSENKDLSIIRFTNRQVCFEHFRFAIVSNQNGTINEMVNFGFYARKQYTPQEAKEILGEMGTVQLKLDRGFEARVNDKSVVRRCE